MKKYSIFILIAILSSSCIQEVEHPRARITNGMLHAQLYLPDADSGYYRGTRFDRSGIISSLEYDGHGFFGQWFEKYNPKAHYSVMGPVDMFEPLNYDETERGGSFVKIGVGTLKKRFAGEYKFSRRYPVVDHGTWHIEEEASRIRFQHVLNDQDFPYVYTKTVEFVEGKPIMKLSYTLENTGQNTIETEVFNHNFFVFDNQKIDESYALTFSEDINASCRGVGDILETEGTRLKFLRSLEEGESVYCSSIEGTDSPIDYDIKVDCSKTGTGVKITGDQPISKMVFWSNGHTICPEPYISLTVHPREKFSWECIYEFYTHDIQ